MPGKNPQLTLESRKQLLLVESELNRVQLLDELHDLEVEIDQLREHARDLGCLASSAAKLTATFAAIGNAFTHRNAGHNGKSSWTSKLFDGLRVGASLWAALRSNGK